MQLVRQPEDSDCCGQACVAMLLGIDLKEAIKLFRSKEATSANKLMLVLRKKGIKPLALCQMGRLTKRMKQWLATGTAIAHYSNLGTAHWVVHHQGTIYDPASGVFKKPPEYLQELQIRFFVLVAC